MGEQSEKSESMMDRFLTRFIRTLGGRASTHVVVVLATILALDSADSASIGAMAPQLQQGLGIGKTELGLLVTVTKFAGAAGTLLFGWLVDRVSRTKLMAVVVLLWCGVMVACTIAWSYMFLLLARVALGIVIAAAMPAIASLIGDYFPPRRRGRIYGYVLVGDLVGTGVGIGIAGELALLSWRVGFGFLALVGLGVAWLVYGLHEPERGGAGRLRLGQERINEPSVIDEDTKPDEDDDSGAEKGRQLIQELIREKGISPRESLVYDENPGRKSLLWAIWYVLRIRTNLVLVISSALGYYFYAGMRTFSVDFIQNWYRVSHSPAIGIVGLFGAAALVGVVEGGRLADYLLARRYLSGRIIVAIVAYFAAAFWLLGALLTRSLAVAIPLLLAAGVSFGAINPPVDAARLDIMHPYLWGRAESVRALLRLLGEGLAPVVFGFLADHIFGGGPKATQLTFLVMLIPLFVSGGIGFIAFYTYPRDVATAQAYTQRTEEAGDRPP